jgi:pimeloyl-ACP methyl ester carboxylesterase
MAQTSARKTFVLVHGAWHGGWCWRRVSDLLEAKGHKVFAPTMTGLGERSHLMSKDVVLDTHIADIVNVIEWEDLKSICLVAHSYGGWPVSGALEKVLDRVTSVVFLDAFIPEDGQRSLDVASDFSRKGTLEAIAKGEISRPAPQAATFHVNEKDRAWVDALCVPHPIRCFTQKLTHTGARERIANRTYIRAAGYPNEGFDAARAKAQANGWRIYDVPCGHDVMVDMPDALVKILEEVAPAR